MGIIGAGAVATKIHLPGYEGCDRAEVVAVTSATASSAKRLASRFSIPTVRATPAELLADTTIDAVSICSPPSNHRELLELACAAGKHALIEKPIALSLADLDAIRALAASAPTVVEVVRNERYMEFNRQAKQVVADGTIGDVHAIIQTISTDGPESWSPSARWFRDQARSGGGALIDLAVHKVDLAAWMVERPLETVPVRAVRDHESVEELALMAFVLAGGVLCSVHASWQGPADESALLVSGSRGLLAGVSSSGRLTSSGEQAGKWEAAAPWSPADDSRQAMIAAFVDHCLTGTRPVDTDIAWDAGTRAVLLAYGQT